MVAFIFLGSLRTNFRLENPISTVLRSTAESSLSRYHVHIHGGGWRDPRLTSWSVEAHFAHASNTAFGPIGAVAGFNYALSQHPTNPNLPYDPAKGDAVQLEREAKHHMNIQDVPRAFALLRSMGLEADEYISSSHSAGACLAFQAILQPPQR